MMHVIPGKNSHRRQQQQQRQCLMNRINVPFSSVSGGARDNNSSSSSSSKMRRRGLVLWICLILPMLAWSLSSLVIMVMIMLMHDDDSTEFGAATLTNKDKHHVVVQIPNHVNLASPLRNLYTFQQQTQQQQQRRRKDHRPKLSSFVWNRTTITTTASTLQQQQEHWDKLPVWLQNYTKWHHEQLQRLHPDNYRDFQFLFLLCLEDDSKESNGNSSSNRNSTSSSNNSCGGLSDRLKPIPLLLLLAHLSNRILLIYWNRPCLLQEFLLPRSPPVNVGGASAANYYSLDWTTPDWLVDHLLFDDGVADKSNISSPPLVVYTSTSSLQRAVMRRRRTSTCFIGARLHDQHGGSQLYNQLIVNNHNKLVVQPAELSRVGGGGDTITTSSYSSFSQARAFRDVFRSIWYLLFEPSPRLQHALQTARKEVQETFSSFFHGNNNNNSSDNNDHDGHYKYAAAHLRAYYGPTTDSHNKNNIESTSSSLSTTATIQNWAVNAVNCASRLHAGGPVVFAADAPMARATVQEYAQVHDLPIHVLSSSSNKNSDHNKEAKFIHLDRDYNQDNEQSPASESSSSVVEIYLNIFVDLYLLSEARFGIAHGQGGFGRLAVLMSPNASHFMTYFSHGQIQECRNWIRTSPLPS